MTKLNNKILVFSDLHLHTWNSFSKNSHNSLTKRLFQQKEILSQISDIAIKEEVSTVEFAGDLFHKVGEIPVVCLNIAYNFISSLRKKELVVNFTIGNHDILNREEYKWFYDSLYIFNKTVDSDIKIKRINFHDCINYEEVKEFDLVILHKTPICSKVGNYTFDEGVDYERLSKQNKIVLFGHIHQRQKLNDNTYIIGASMHLTFGDEGERGCYIIDVKSYEVKFVKLNYPEFRTVNSYLDVKDDYNYYRVLNINKEKINDVKSNVIMTNVPEFYNERIKSDDFNSILNEWLVLKNKPIQYLDLIKDIVDSKYKVNKDIIKYKLDEVHIMNFMSIGDIEYKIDGKGFVVVKGEGEIFNSNGAGKSSLFDSIFWALFNKTTKGLTGDDVIKRGEKDCKVVLRINDYIISRDRAHGLVVTKNHKDITSGLKQQDRQMILENDILGFDEKVFLSSCYFSQENLMMLTGMTDVERTDMITNLLGFESYDNLYESIFTKIKLKDNLITETEENIRNISNSSMLIKSKHDINNDRKIRIKDNITSLNIKIQDCDYIISSLEKKSNSILEINAIDYIKEFDKFNENDKLLDKRYKFLEKCLKVLNDKMNEFIKNRNEIRYDLKSIIENIDTTNKEINSLSHLKFDEVCDKCGSIVNENNVNVFLSCKHGKISEFNAKKEKLEASLIELDSKIISLKQKTEDYEKQFNGVINSQKDIKVSVNKLIKEKDEYSNKVKNAEKEKFELKSKISEQNVLIKKYREDIKVYENEILECDSIESELNRKIKENEKEIELLDKNIVQIKSEIECLEFWKIAFSSKGIRVFLLDKFCNELNYLVNDFVSIISSGVMSVNIKPITVLKSGDERNKLGLDILFNNNVVKYESLSGGEKRRIDISFCLGLNKWIINKFCLSHSLLGFIVLDEIFSYLDDTAEQCIGMLLESESKDKEIFVITHTNELSNYSNREWIVEKINGESKLKIMK